MPSKRADLELLCQLRKNLKRAKGLKKTKLLEQYLSLRNKIVEENMSLVYWFLGKRKFNLNSSEANEDLKSDMMLILIQAVDTFDLEKGTSLSSYIFWKINNKINSLLKEENRLRPIEDFAEDSLTCDMELDPCIKEGLAKIKAKIGAKKTDEILKKLNGPMNEEAAREIKSLRKLMR